ncbi:MAG: hypothetical protein MUF68_05250 [Cyclobacteriaceae bacterium]|jgi:hypothetical protein|nr:hypothetical protein [Cyclobacteriaceae bacterium]
MKNPDFQNFIVVRKLNLLRFEIEFEVWDDEFHQRLFLIKEKNISFFQKILRLLNIPQASFSLGAYSDINEELFSVSKKFTWFKSTTKIYNSQNRIIGILKRNYLSANGEKYLLMDVNTNLNFIVKIDSGTLNFAIKNTDDVSIARVLREAEEIKAKQKDVVAKSDSLRSMYFVSRNSILNKDVDALWLILSTVVSLDLIFMDRADDTFN